MKMIREEKGIQVAECDPRWHDTPFGPSQVQVIVAKAFTPDGREFGMQAAYVMENDPSANAEKKAGIIDDLAERLIIYMDSQP